LIRQGSDKTGEIIVGGTGILLLFAPLPYGSVHPWAYSLLQLGVGGLLSFWMLVLLLHPEGLRYRSTPLDLPLLLFLCLCLFQLLPLPAPWARALSPQAHDRYSAVLASSFHPLSLYPFATIRQLFQIATYLGLFYLIAYHADTAIRLRRLLLLLFLSGSFQALYGLYRHFSGQPILHPGRASGTFINPNHFAGYLEVVIPLSLSLYLLLARRQLSGLPWKQYLVALFDSRRSAPLALLLLGLAVMILAAIFSISRAGIVSLAAALMTFGLGSLYLRRRRRWAFRILLLCAVALLLGLWEGLGPVEERFLQAGPSLLSRYQIWPAVLEMIRDHPLFGTGLGTFGPVFLCYQQEHPSFFFDHAHNDYLEILSEVGGIGFALLALAGLLFLLRSLSGLARSSVREGQVIALGGISGLVALSLHSLMDFNLAIPANSLTLAAALGITHRAVQLGKEERP